MKPAHLIKGLSVALLFVFSSGIVLAQHPTETCPESALPVITFRPVQVPNAPPGTLYTNYFQFSVDWAGDAATCHNNPPLPIHPDQVDTAKWMYFWNFDDETYSGDTMPMHAFKESGTYTVEVALKPIYSDDKDPFKKPKATFSIVVPPGPDPAKKDTAYQMLPDTDALKLVANWYASRPTGKLTFAITYRVRSQSAISGKVLFLHSAERLEIVDVQRAPSEGSREDVPAGLRTPEALKGFSWEFTNLRADDGEKTIFIDVQVPANVSTEINDTSTVQATVFAAIGYDNGSDALDSTGPTVPTDPGSDVVDIAVTKTAAPPPAKQEAPFFDILFGTSKAGADGVADSELENNFEEVYDFYREEMSPVAINYASDPNFILWHPLMLPPGAMNETLSYEVHFQNDGSASADGDDLRVTIGIDPLQNPEGVVPGSSYPACLDIRTFPHVIEWSTKKTLIEDPTCKLNALGDARALGFSEGATWGHVAHTMQTKPGYVFKTGDTIYAQAAVKMGLSEVKTDVSKIPVGIPAFCSQGFFGLKFAYHLANDEHRSGWGLALTARYPLGKVKNPGFEAHLNHAINKKNYPLFWWQGELGYGQTRHRPAMNDSFFVRHIDVSPFVLRFIAKKPPLRIGSVGIQRGWGLSAGYTGSYLFSSQRNGADDTSFERMSFTDRLDHSLSVTADFLNLIGQPGLSLGAGYRWRNTQIGGQRHWYSNAFIYLHYTFSYRLRKEFGWLN